MIPPSLENEPETVAKCQPSNAERYCPPSSTVNSGGSVVADRTPSPAAIRLVGSAAACRKPAVPAWRSSTQYQFVKRAGVWIETYREDPFAVQSLIATG